MHRRVETALVLVAAIIAGLAVAPPARGTEASQSEADRAQQLYLEGMAMYRAGKYRSAIRSFEDAYRNYPDPKLMYNLARSYEAIGNPEAAASRYRKCMADPGAEYDLQQKARNRLEKVELALQRSAAAPAEQRPSGPVAPGGQRDTASTSWISVSKWVSGALGVGLLAGGAVLLGLGLSDEGELDDARTEPGAVSSLTRVQAAGLGDDAESKQTTGYILLGTGAAMAVASVALFIVDAKQRAARDRPATDKASGSAGRYRLTFGVTPLIEGGALTVGGLF